jgi:hypothetical protein
MVLRTVVLVLLLLLVLSQLQRPPLFELPPTLFAWFRYVGAWRGVNTTQVRQCELPRSDDSLY